MWVFAMFDLPVTTAEARKDYARFRKALLREGFCMLQLSVYARYCPSEEAANTFRKRIQSFLPPKGYVRVLAVTDCQFGKMESYVGKMAKTPEQPPEQLLLF
jgi:CRISPR-associated protein Cas2